METSLTREEVIKAIERKRSSRIPLVRAKWWGEGLCEQYGEKLKALDRYPEDVVWLFVGNPVAPRKMTLPWTWNSGRAHDSTCVIDVQHTLQEKDPEGVSEEVRFLIDTFDWPDGGMCIAAGNGIVAGTPFENIEAFLDEAVVYGREHRNAAH
jgi:hypothetical protein